MSGASSGCLVGFTKSVDDSSLRQYTSLQIISLDLISFGFLAYIDAVCRL